MKEFYCGIAAVCIAIGLVSRGSTGDKVVGPIAANHLTDKAKASMVLLNMGGAYPHWLFTIVLRDANDLRII